MITVFTGPMFSGKSSKLIEIYSSMHYTSKIIAFKPSKDIRDKTKIKSREYIKDIEANVIKSLDEIPKYLDNTRKVIMIDEVQFLKGDTKILLDLSVKEDYEIYISGLALTSEQKPFGKMPDILAIADKIEWLTADCHYCGREAKFTKCLEEKDEEILVGSNQYIPVCKYCLKDRF